MSRRGRGMVAGGDDQFAASQILERCLNGAFRKTSPFREGTQTCRNRFPLRPRGLAVEMQIDKISGRQSIMSNQITHQDVDYVIFD